jgi:hypothetical protein
MQQDLAKVNSISTVGSSPEMKKPTGYKIKYSHLNLSPPVNQSSKIKQDQEMVNLSGFSNFVDEIDYDYSKILDEKEK